MARRGALLVGRSREAADLRAAVLAGLAGTGPALVLVLGDAGVGKSALVASFLDAALVVPAAGDAADGRPPVVCRGAALPGGAATPLLPWADALRQAVSTYGVDVAARAAGAALADLAVLVPDLDPGAGAGTDGRAADLLPWYVGRLAAIRPSGDRAGGPAPRRRRHADRADPPRRPAPARGRRGGHGASRGRAPRRRVRRRVGGQRRGSASPGDDRRRSTRWPRRTRPSSSVTSRPPPASRSTR